MVATILFFDEQNLCSSFFHSGADESTCDFHIVLTNPNPWKQAVMWQKKIKRNDQTKWQDQKDSTHQCPYTWSTLTLSPTPPSPQPHPLSTPIFCPMSAPLVKTNSAVFQNKTWTTERKANEKGGEGKKEFWPGKGENLWQNKAMVIKAVPLSSD